MRISNVNIPTNVGLIISAHKKIELIFILKIIPI